MSAPDEHQHTGHHHHHHHHDPSALSSGKLLLVILFNLAISAAEVVGGILSGSLALISDAIHNLSDTASLILSYISIRISLKPKTKTKTYGYKRANILSAFVNAAVLIGIAIYLVVEAVRRFFSPSQVTGNIVIMVAAIGLLGNLFSVLILKKSSKESINIRSSYLHLVSDTLSSVAVIAAGILLQFTALLWIDPVLTVVINIIILRSSYLLLKESIDILMQGTPLDLDVDRINAALLEIKGVQETHHLHVWRLDEKTTVLEGHILIDDMMISESKAVSDQIQHLLQEHFGIEHLVIQFESVPCSDNDCSI